MCKRRRDQSVLPGEVQGIDQSYRLFMVNSEGGLVGNIFTVII
mgnify:CR=1 FL=1